MEIECAVKSGRRGGERQRDGREERAMEERVLPETERETTLSHVLQGLLPSTAL